MSADRSIKRLTALVLAVGATVVVPGAGTQAASAQAVTATTHSQGNARAVTPILRPARPSELATIRSSEVRKAQAFAYHPAGSARYSNAELNASAADAATQVQPVPDLRSPDAQDAAEGRGAWTAPRVMVVRISRPQVSNSGGFDWTDAGIGAGGALGLMLLAVGGTLVLAHGRRGARRARRTAMMG